MNIYVFDALHASYEMANVHVRLTALIDAAAAITRVVLEYCSQQVLFDPDQLGLDRYWDVIEQRKLQTVPYENLDPHLLGDVLTCMHTLSYICHLLEHAGRYMGDDNAHTDTTSRLCETIEDLTDLVSKWARCSLRTYYIHYIDIYLIKREKK